MAGQKEARPSLGAMDGQKTGCGEAYTSHRITQTQPTVKPQFHELIQEELSELAAYDQWVAWIWGPIDPKTGKPRKIPINPHDGENGSSTDPGTWGTVQQALDAMERLNLPGVGFVLSEDDPFFALDVDDCLSGDPGPVLEIIEKMNTYTERSPSKKGLRLIGRGKMPEWSKNKTGNFEAYDKKRFVTITGDVYGGFGL